LYNSFDGQLCGYIGVMFRWIRCQFVGDFLKCNYFCLYRFVDICSAAYEVCNNSFKFKHATVNVWLNYIDSFAHFFLIQCSYKLQLYSVFQVPILVSIKQTNKQTTERTNQQTNKQTNGRTNERTNERTNKCKKKTNNKISKEMILLGKPILQNTYEKIDNMNFLFIL